MTDVTLRTPRIEVVIERDGELVAAVVQTDNRDAVRWDMTRGREGWPATPDAPMLWATFVAWSAMNRAGDFPGKFSEFNEVCLQAAPAQDDDTEAGPTQ